MDRSERADALRPVVQEAVDRSSLRRVADEIGVSHGTLHNYLEKGQTPYKSTLSKIEQWADSVGQGGATGETGDPRYPDGGIATADQIIDTFGRPEALRRQAGHIPAKDAARAGYALAQRLQLPPAGMKRILEWHDEIMGAEGEGG